MPNVHEAYAKEVLRAVFGERFDDRRGVRGLRDPNVAGRIIDGVIDDRVAVEITRGTAKAIAGEACLLARHPLPYKLLVVVRGGAYNDSTARQAATNLLETALNDSALFRVVLLGNLCTSILVWYKPLVGSGDVEVRGWEISGRSHR